MYGVLYPKMVNKDIHKIEMSVKRQEQKQQGVFDGRYNTRTETPLNKYNRKIKHKLKQEKGND